MPCIAISLHTLTSNSGIINFPMVSFSIGKFMIPLFEVSGCNEFAMQGIGAHKNGPLAAMWLEMLVFVH